MLKFARYFALLIVAGVAVLPATSQTLPGNHPGYLHALSDLRAARWLLNHQPGDAKVYANEDSAIQEIDAAIAEIKRAAIDDGKNINDHPAIDVRDHGSRLLRSIEFLQKAHNDIDREEDNPAVREFRHRASGHIEHATKHAEHAHDEWLKDGGR
jgi:hypothetical protein